ncbi:hypothetical protein [Candidatus Methylopumilus planktonicus]|jgi:hypothetical protein|uniref:hypothetical protein n=1 Tax=Candidatus Methylopumilus planktonicus TaxID=1581557 RepID=UPI003BEF3870
MKNFGILFLMALNISCASLMNPQEQPVELIDGKANIYSTTCSGLAETMGTCHQKAKGTCKQGYEVLNESVDSSGVHRKIKFQCK